jgi:hypothetical protein
MYRFLWQGLYLLYFKWLDITVPVFFPKEGTVCLNGRGVSFLDMNSGK